MSEARRLIAIFEGEIRSVILPPDSRYRKQEIEVLVAENPDRLIDVIRGLELNNSQDIDLRILVDSNTCDLYTWDANLGIHKDVADALGVNYEECIRGDADNWHNGKWGGGLEDPGWRIRADHPNYDACIRKVESVFGRYGSY